MKIVICEPGKHPYVKEIDGELKTMQALVEGNIQVIYPFDDLAALVCNEEGLFLDIPWNRFLETHGPIKGTFFIAGIDSEDFCSLTEAQTATYLKEFWEIHRIEMDEEGLSVFILDDGTTPPQRGQVGRD